MLALLAKGQEMTPDDARAWLNGLRVSHSEMWLATVGGMQPSEHFAIRAAGLAADAACCAQALTILQAEHEGFVMVEAKR